MDKNTYKVLKYINRGNKYKQYNQVINRFKGNKFPSVEDSIFMLGAAQMISINYDYDENNNATEPLTISIEPDGREYIETVQLESRRHWQNIFIPQPLNVIVSAITTVITFFILKYLQG